MSYDSRDTLSFRYPDMDKEIKESFRPESLFSGQHALAMRPAVLPHLQMAFQNEILR
jgi:hypothetical protein